MWKSRGMVAVLVSGLLLGILLGSPAFTADPKTATVAFGSADADKLFKEYDKRQQAYQELEALKARLERQLELRLGNKLLSDQEFKQLLDLETKPQKQESDKKKIEELLAISKQRDQELQTLQQKQDATDAEKTRRTELENQLKSVTAALQADKEKFEDQLNKQLVEVNRQAAVDIEAAVAAVAKEKGLTMVFNKSFGAVEFILYSSTDITEAVLKRLNKK